MSGIYDIDKMKQKPIYPTKETSQYSDWALFNMGKELEDYVDTLTPGGGDYIAGTGIEITPERVINNTAPGIQYVAGDGIDISGSTISSLVKGLEFVSYAQLVLEQLTPGYGGHITIQNLDNNYDYFIFVEVDDGSHCQAPSSVTRGGSSIDLYVFNRGGGDLSGIVIGQYTIYRTKKKESWNYIHIIGSVAANANLVPMGGTTGEVLAKISDTNYSVIWKSIGKTITIQTLLSQDSDLSAIIAALNNAPVGTEFVINNLTYRTGTSTTDNTLSGRFTKVTPTETGISAIFVGMGASSASNASPVVIPMLALNSGNISVYNYNMSQHPNISSISGDWSVYVMTYN